MSPCAQLVIKETTYLLTSAQQAAVFELDGALLTVLLDASGSPLRNGTNASCFVTMVISLAQCTVSWAALSAAALMGQRLANYTRAPGHYECGR